jgi:hypothetical protein
MPRPKSSSADVGQRRGEAPGIPRRNNSGEVPARHPRGLLLAAVAVIALLGVGIGGCGGGDSQGAVVSVYVGAPLCKAARAELASHGATAGHFKIAARCLAPSERGGGGVDLATDGSNSRRATSDTSAVATLESPGPGNKFTRPILESAGIPLVTSPSGTKGMKRVIEAIESAGSGQVRDKVRETLEPS